MVNRRRAFLAVLGAVWIVVLFAALTPALTEEITGTVRSVRLGKLERRDGETWRALSPGAAVNFGDRVRTGEKAIAVILMPGQGRFVIGPGSEITLGRNEREAEARLERGAVWIRADLSAGRGYSIRTPIATAGVRGTSFSVLADTDGAAVCTCRGAVEVTLSDSRVIASRTAQFVPVAADGSAPSHASSDRRLLNRMTGGRYDWCFSCHEIGGRGRLRHRETIEDY